MVADLTGLPLANASLLDEATAAAEAMAMCLAIARSAGQERKEFFVSQDCHPQTIAVMQTRAEPLGITLHIGRTKTIDFSNPQLSGMSAAVSGYRRLCGRLWCTCRAGAQSRDSRCGRNRSAGPDPVASSR